MILPSDRILRATYAVFERTATPQQRAERDNELIKERPPGIWALGVALVKDRLGTCKDSDLAREAQVSVSTVRNWRESLNIPCYAESKSRQPKSTRSKSMPLKFELVKDRLGTCKDVDLAREAQVSFSTVRIWRLRLNIPRHVGPRSTRPKFDLVKDRLGTCKDEDLAREVGVTKTTISTWRKSLNIPSYVAPKLTQPKSERQRPVRQWIETIRDRLGIVSDAELAREIGGSKSRISRVRIQLGIPHPLPSSKLDAYAHLFGSISDAEITRVAGVSRELAANYRSRRPHLPPSPRARRKAQPEPEESSPLIAGATSDVEPASG